MKLSKTYVIGTHVMFYEIEMYKEFIDGLINLIEPIQNKENIYLHFCFNTSQYFEKIDTNKIEIHRLYDKFYEGVQKLYDINVLKENVVIKLKTDNEDVYNVADYRRDLNYNYCTKVDYIMWGETDSFFPKEAFNVIESVAQYGASANLHKYILSFSDRKMWDESWKVTEHVDYENVKFVDTPDQVNNKNYAKSQLSIEEMNTINSKTTEFDIRALSYPKIDGSCLVLSSDLIKSGVNLPHSLLLYGDDSSIGTIAKQIMGDKFIQFVVKNILKVHARRHPNKRVYILNENNPRGYCGDKKGEWSVILDQHSKFNLHNILNSQNKFFTFKDVFDKIKL